MFLIVLSVYMKQRKTFYETQNGWISHLQYANAM